MAYKPNMEDIKKLRTMTGAGLADVKKALVEAEGKGIRLIDKEPRLGAENMMIGFLHPKMTAGILTELCEPKK